VGADGGGLVAQGAAAVGLNRFQRVQIGEMAIDERRVRQGSEALGGLEFRRVGREGEVMHAIGHDDRRSPPPAAPSAL